MLTFYDIPSTLPINAWSPNTWKTRYCLNYKGIPYKTEWVEYPDIQPLCLRMGIAPTGTEDGKPYYSLPAIYDPSTGIAIADSWLIAEYLDKTYPDTPKMFPHGSAVIQRGFFAGYASRLAPIEPFILPRVNLKLNAASEVYFRRTRELYFGKRLEDAIPTGEEGAKAWKQLEDGLTVVAGWLKVNGATGPFVMGDTASFADCVLAAYTLWMKLIFGEDSKEWKDIKSWDEGRWEKVIEVMKDYSAVV